MVNHSQRGRAKRSGCWRALCATTLLFSVCLGSASAEPVRQFSGGTMGTSYHVKFLGDVDTGPLQEAVDQRLSRINERMSTYIPDSEVSRFNRAAADEWFPVSAETLRVVELGLNISRQTGGAFDMTVAPLVRLWGFGAGADDGSFAPPADAAIDGAMQWVGSSKLEVRREPPALRKAVAQLEIDLSAIAKGYAVDEVANLLDEAGIDHYMVEIGGEVRVSGTTSAGAWRIGIEAPDAGSRRVATVLQLSDQALASSGDYRNFHEHQGTRYSHTIDPRTGRPVTHPLAAVSILADDCATADALATALLVMGEQGGAAWAESEGYAAMFFSRGKGSTVVGSSTSQMREQQPAAVDEVTASLEAGGSMTQLAVMSLVVFGIAIAAMSVGVIFGRRRIQGSCGGLAGLRDAQGKTMCEACTNPSPACQGEPMESQGP